MAPEGSKIRTPLKHLIAAGHMLKVDPETFEVSVGPMKGRAINMTVTEQVTAAPRRVVSVNGEISKMPGKTTYSSQLTVVWDVDSALQVTSQSSHTLADFQQRLKTCIEYASIEDQEFTYEAREI